MTGQKLNDYMRDNILQPLGIKDMSMIPTEEMKSKLAYMNHREYDGTMRPRDHLMRAPLVLSSNEEAGYFNSGGAGMFANPQEYCSMSRIRFTLFLRSNVFSLGPTGSCRLMQTHRDTGCAPQRWEVSKDRR